MCCTIYIFFFFFEMVYLLLFSLLCFRSFIQFGTPARRTTNITFRILTNMVGHFNEQQFLHSYHPLLGEGVSRTLNDLFGFDGFNLDIK